MGRHTYSPPRVIAIDVDGTLRRSGAVNDPLVKWCRAQAAAGFQLMLWSARGRAYAEAIAAAYDVTDLFDVICAKPGYIVDDKGWDWIKGTRIIRKYE